MIVIMKSVWIIRKRFDVLKSGFFIEKTRRTDVLTLPSKVSVSYTGTGENLSKIFDPYFTTKRMGPRKGMGFGPSVLFHNKKHEGFEP